HGRLINLYRLETTLQRRVLFNVLAVLIQRGRTNGLQLTASQLRFEQGRRIDSAFCGTCADQGVDLVDEQDDIAALVELGRRHDARPTPSTAHQPVPARTDAPAPRPCQCACGTHPTWSHQWSAAHREPTSV